tara:strand:- start:1257 stop:1481 length:225 start_codon:yes stop_codon:yes gene_type:complete
METNKRKGVVMTKKDTVTKQLKKDKDVIINQSNEKFDEIWKELEELNSINKAMDSEISELKKNVDRINDRLGLK